MEPIGKLVTQFQEKLEARKKLIQEKQKQYEIDKNAFLAKNPKPTSTEKCEHGANMFSYEIEYGEDGFKWEKKKDLFCYKCMAEEQKVAKLNNAHAILKIPKRYSGIKSDNQYLKLLKDGKGLLFIGGVGTGKTYSLISTLLALAEERDKYIQFQTFSEVARAIRESIGDNSYNRVYDKYVSSEILVMDDIGTENTTDFMKEFMYNMINDRYNNMLPIMITTNLDSQELSRIYSQRIVSRLFEMCEIIRLEGEDKRKRK